MSARDVAPYWRLFERDDFAPRLEKTNSDLVVDIDKDGDMEVSGLEESMSSAYVPLVAIRELIAAHERFLSRTKEPTR